MRLNQAQVSRIAIQRLYISMRHLFFRGHYKPLGVSGEAMINAMLELSPEIYGSVADPTKVELNGLLYVFQRLPLGIEECRFINLISREGFEDSSFEPIVPAKRRRNCYRVDSHQMNIEMTRGRSDIYDVLTHLTFLFIEAEKIKNHALDYKGRVKREWFALKEINDRIQNGKSFNVEVGLTYLSSLLGRTFEEVSEAYLTFSNGSKVNNLFSIIYHLGQRSIDEQLEELDREINFSATLREELGHHFFGEPWASNIKAFIIEKGWADRPIHVISSNLHSVMNSLYALSALKRQAKNKSLEAIASKISQDESGKLSAKIRSFALQHGMHELHDDSGTNITVQIIDFNQVPKTLCSELKAKRGEKLNKDLILIVMDYAFGEQAFECMDELLKPHETGTKEQALKVESINIMGKAGILEGGKSDVMIPDAHVFEGTADNYPFKNQIDCEVFDNSELGVYHGPMITVMGTSLQNKDILRYFKESSWKAVGLEMEGAHYQKAIQSASMIRNSVKKSLKLRYAYYASDNPLHTGSTLASGGLGVDGVRPTYLITQSILRGILYK